MKSAGLTVQANIRLTPDEGWDIETITGRPRSAGNVGVAFSGGGARAASAAMGQARALHEYGLLSQVRAISAVSGGSWFSVPFTFLPSHYDDEEFLGAFVADPAALRWEEGDAATALLTMSERNFAVPLTKFSISTLGMVWSALTEWVEQVGVHRLWTRKIGTDLLAYFDLASFNHDTELNDDFFAASDDIARSILQANPQLPQRYYTIREGGAVIRPYLIVNGAMRVQGSSGRDVLAPIQFTPWWAGILGADIGSLAGAELGEGGAISPFAFGGRAVARDGERVSFAIQAPLTLCDIAGISSVAFADILSDHGIGSLDPEYSFWSPGWSAPGGADALFEDGGSLENTGVAALLAYRDIDAIIAFINAPTPVRVVDGEVEIDEQVPALFGLQRFQRGRGYPSFASPGSGNRDFADNQVFANDSGEFDELLRTFEITATAGRPIVHRQRLTTVSNRKFAVRGGKQIDVVWVYLNPSAAWAEQLDRKVHRKLARNFPNYPTLETELRVDKINVLAHFSSWVVTQHLDDLRAIFDPRRRPPT